MLATAARSKTAPPKSHAKTHENMYLCTHATKHTPHRPHTVSSLLSHLLSSLCLSFSVLFLCRLSPCDVVCDVVLCCVWECMWCLWCGVVGGRGVFGVCLGRRVLTCSREVHQRNRWILPNSSLRKGRTRHVPDSFNHSLYLMRTVQLQLQ